MVHREWVRKDDPCSLHLKDCPDGYSFSLWEKNGYDSNTMVNYGLIKFQKKYIVSSGAEYDLDKGTACPGRSNNPCLGVNLGQLISLKTYESLLNCKKIKLDRSGYMPL